MDTNIPKQSIKARIALLQLDHITKPKPPEKFSHGDRNTYHHEQNVEDANYYQPQPRVVPNTQYIIPAVSRPLPLTPTKSFNETTPQHKPRTVVVTQTTTSHRASWHLQNTITSVHRATDALFLHANQRQRRQTVQPDRISAPLPLFQDNEIKKSPPPRPPPPAFQKTEIKNAAPPLPPKYSSPPMSNIPLTPAVNTLISRSIPQQKAPIPYEDIGFIPTTSNGNSTNACYECIDYSLADAQAAKFPRHSVTSIPLLAQNLTSQFSDPVMKARAIFTWFYHNIAYDTQSYFGGNIKHKEPEETLWSGLAVCQGYAELYQKIGQYAGLEVLVISGHGKGYSHRAHSGGTIPAFDSNHAWNAVKLNGRWKPIDPCWGSGHISNSRQYEKCFKPNHFTHPPEVFRLRHFPTKPEHQFCATSMSWQEYILMKEGPTIFTGFTEKGFNDAEVLPNIKRIPSGQPTKFVVKSRCQHHHIKPEDRYVLLLSINRSDTPLRMEVEGCVWSVTMPSLNRGTVHLYYLDKLGGRSAQGVTVEEYESSKGRLGWSTIGMAQWEVY